MGRKAKNQLNLKNQKKTKNQEINLNEDYDKYKKMEFTENIMAFLAGFMTLIVCVVALGIFCIGPVKIPEANMLPNYSPGSIAIVDKLSYIFKMPYKGDVVCISQNGDIIRRIIGVPGDEIRIENNQIYINGVAQTEEYDTSGFMTETVNTVIPKGYYFVLNDNRDDPSDSRSGYLIASEKIEGKVIIFSDDIKNFVR